MRASRPWSPDTARDRRDIKMKVAVVLCFAASLAVAAAPPPPGGFGGFMPSAAGAFVPSPAMIQAFVPTPEQINALNALHTTPAPGAAPAPAVAPGAPTAPPKLSVYEPDVCVNCQPSRDISLGVYIRADAPWSLESAKDRRDIKMKVAVVLCFAASLAVAAAVPPPGGFGGYMPPPAGAFVPSPAMIQAFIPTPEEIQALNALHTTPAPGAAPAPAVAPGTPTAPPRPVPTAAMGARKGNVLGALVSLNNSITCASHINKV
ncbi:hypothetical protein C7M84_000222 [Penaeus vannamei]|uniref:Uncharacterized protein n=1 Tax=Penaeus vannamei TaxID=6689 RepID=A0A423TX56_PENVA|nr:hypothetical protein C7M84_000222 [Penaeus vannamei]